MTDEEIEQVVDKVLAGVRPRMRRVIGDSTSAQYDKADALAQAIAESVRSALKATA